MTHLPNDWKDWNRCYPKLMVWAASMAAINRYFYCNQSLKLTRRRMIVRQELSQNPVSQSKSHYLGTVMDFETYFTSEKTP